MATRQPKAPVAYKKIRPSLHNPDLLNISYGSAQTKKMAQAITA